MEQDLSAAEWRKSSFSGGAQNCVEVAGNLAGIVAVRDSKNPDGSALVVTRERWAAFAEAVRAGEPRAPLASPATYGQSSPSGGSSVSAGGTD